jgi:hypothetical protein
MVVALVAAILAAIIAVTVPLVTFRLALRQDAARWLRERRADLYVDLLTEAQAEQNWLENRLAEEDAREMMAPHFVDTRLPRLERARLGSRFAIYGSKTVNRLFGQLSAAGQRALLNLDQLDRDALQLRTRVEIGDIIDKLEETVRRELGPDHIRTDALPPADAAPAN